MLSERLTIRTKPKSLYTPTSNIGLMMGEKKNDGNEKRKGCPPSSGRFCVSMSLPPLAGQLQHFKYGLQAHTDFAFHNIISSIFLSISKESTAIFSPVINILNTRNNLKRDVGPRGFYKSPSGSVKKKYLSPTINLVAKEVPKNFFEEEPTSRRPFNFMEANE